MNEGKPSSRKRARQKQRSPKKNLETAPRTPEEIESTISERDTNASTGSSHNSTKKLKKWTI